MPTATYALDVTGTSTANLVQGEVHVTNSDPTRIFVAQAGDFFTDTLRIVDSDTGQPLALISQYLCLQNNQEATDLTGKNVASIIKILDPAVVNIVITYQCIGGIYQNQYNALVNMLNLNLGSLPPNLSWNQIIGVPLTFPPAIHFHPASDWYGLGEVVTILNTMRDMMASQSGGAYGMFFKYMAAYINAWFANNIGSSLTDLTGLINAITALQNKEQQDFNTNSNAIGDLQDGLSQLVSSYNTFVAATNQDFSTIAGQIQAIQATLNAPTTGILARLASLSNTLNNLGVTVSGHTTLLGGIASWQTAISALLTANGVGADLVTVGNLAAGTNLNSVTNIGEYTFGSGLTNGPDPSWTAGNVKVWRQSATVISQLIQGIIPDGLALRSKTNGSWSNWVILTKQSDFIALQGWVQSLNDILTGHDNYLFGSGGARDQLALTGVIVGSGRPTLQAQIDTISANIGVRYVGQLAVSRDINNLPDATIQIQNGQTVQVRLVGGGGGGGGSTYYNDTHAAGYDGGASYCYISGNLVAQANGGGGGGGSSGNSNGNYSNGGIGAIGGYSISAAFTASAVTVIFAANGNGQSSGSQSGGRMGYGENYGVGGQPGQFITNQGVGGPGGGAGCVAFFYTNNSGGPVDLRVIAGAGGARGVSNYGQQPTAGVSGYVAIII